MHARIAAPSRHHLLAMTTPRPAFICSTNTLHVLYTLYTHRCSRYRCFSHSSPSSPLRPRRPVVLSAVPPARVSLAAACIVTSPSAYPSRGGTRNKIYCIGMLYLLPHALCHGRQQCDNNRQWRPTLSRGLPEQPPCPGSLDALSNMYSHQTFFVPQV